MKKLYALSFSIVLLIALPILAQRPTPGSMAPVPIRATYRRHLPEASAAPCLRNPWETGGSTQLLTSTMTSGMDMIGRMTLAFTWIILLIMDTSSALAQSTATISFASTVTGIGSGFPEDFTLK
jgi:hypothetical protein